MKDKNGVQLIEGSKVKQWLEDACEPLSGFWWIAEVRKDSAGDLRVYQIGFKYSEDEEAILLSELHSELEIINEITQTKLEL
jgi:hypothetical protein